MCYKRALMYSELEELLFASDSDDNCVSEVEDHLSEFESETDESDENNEDHRKASECQGDDYIISKNGSIYWKSSPPSQQGRLSSANVISLKPGPTRYAISRINDIKSSFCLYFKHNIIALIIKMSNIEGKAIYGDQWIELTEIEFSAYLGVLLVAGVYRSHGEATESLWNSSVGRPILEQLCLYKDFIQFQE